MKLVWITYLPWLVLLVSFLFIPVYAEPLNCKGADSYMNNENGKTITDRLDVLIKQQKTTNKLLEVQITGMQYILDYLATTNKLLYEIVQLLYDKGKAPDVYMI
jgi:hypothetical protein